ncbi:hypothetical protein SK128_010603 [Halocaridina rubra]|uniref:Chitin-binding type-2 domain-containing protein n=1 Tax=Halocaridina rubra TaxID=373956 RepID=A0AAN9ADQ0_HALRR
MICDDRVYGYYADQDNNCQIFHICHPYVDGDFFVKTRMFSFICGAGLVFDQSKLVCDFPEASIPCDVASQYYNINNYFGRVDLNFREGRTPDVPASELQVQTFRQFSEENLQPQQQIPENFI